MRVDIDSWWDRADQALTSKPARVVQVLLSVCTLLLAGVLTVQQASTRDCLVRYAVDNAAATTARAEIAEEDRRADDADRAAFEAERRAFLRLVLAIQSAADRSEQQAAFLALVATYQRGDEVRSLTAKTRADNAKQRADNPIPVPALTCN